MNIHKIFKTSKPIIGMIHLPPLVGYSGYPGIQVIKKRVRREVMALVTGGVQGIMVENNYDIPHKEFVDSEVSVVMADITADVVKHAALPVGVCVLWNDYKTALKICAVTGARFIRVPAFVDDVRTQYGDMLARADEVIHYRKKMQLEHRVAILADVQVKHSEMIDKTKQLAVSVREAVAKGADAIIITGKWTGDAPFLNDLSKVKQLVQSLPIIVGSGSTQENLYDLLSLCDGIIVGTAIMEHGVVRKSKVVKYMEAYNIQVSFLNDR